MNGWRNTLFCMVVYEWTTKVVYHIQNPVLNKIVFQTEHFHYTARFLFWISIFYALFIAHGIASFQNVKTTPFIYEPKS